MTRSKKQPAFFVLLSAGLVVLVAACQYCGGMAEHELEWDAAPKSELKTREAKERREATAELLSNPAET